MSSTAKRYSRREAAELAEVYLGRCPELSVEQVGRLRRAVMATAADGPAGMDAFLAVKFSSPVAERVGEVFLRALAETARPDQA